jgi:hypothetical protein
LMMVISAICVMALKNIVRPRILLFGPYWEFSLYVWCARPGGESECSQSWFTHAIGSLFVFCVMALKNIVRPRNSLFSVFRIGVPVIECAWV